MDDLYCTLSGKINGFLSSHVNININFNHKIKEIQTLIVDEHFEENTMIKLKSQLSDLHSLLDLKLKCTEEMNSICTLQNKAFLDIKNHLLDVDSNLDISPNVYSEMQTLHCDSNQSLLNSDELIHPRLKMMEAKDPLIINQVENTKKKILMHSHSIDGGPLLRKKLNFNLKQAKHKSNKFVPFKKQNMFKNVEDSNFLKPNGIHLTSNDSKYINFSNKRKRLSLSNSLMYSRRTRNQPKKSNLWDHEDTRVYCICNKPSYGDMIACDSEKCKIEWFHYKCVDITTSPKGDWFCPMCKIA